MGVCGSKDQAKEATPVAGGIPEDFPKDIAVTRILYKTWDESVIANHVLCCDPKTDADVEAVVNWAVKGGWRVRATGIKHNWSPLTITNQGIEYDDKEKKHVVKSLDKYLLINLMANMTAVSVEQYDGKPAARAQAGVGNAAFLKKLEETKSGDEHDIGYGWTHGPAPDSISLGGMLAINGHGTAVPLASEAAIFAARGCTPVYGTLSNRVLEIKAVAWDDASGTYKVQVFKRSDSKALPFLTHLGRSVVTEVVLQVEKNYYMRCDSTLDDSWRVVFPPTTDPANPPEKSLAWHLKRSGRVEAIWFPFTENPWVHIWTVTDHNKPADCELVTECCPYPWTDKYDDKTIDLFKSLVSAEKKVRGDAIEAAEAEHEPPKKCLEKLTDAIMDAVDGTVELVGTPKLTPTVNKLLFKVLKNGFVDNKREHIWGPSKNTLIYVRDTTLRVTANGYVITTSEDNVQEVMYQFAVMYDGLLQKFAAMGKYPIANPLEIRVTGLDIPDHIGDGNAAGAPVTAVTYDDECKKNNWTHAVWLDVLSMPESPGSADFYVEMEALVMRNPAMTGTKGRVRPEWSKGWGYTKDGPWLNQSFLDHTRSSLPRWNEMVAELDKHDPKKLFTNAWLEQFCKPVTPIDGQFDLRTKSAVVAAKVPIGVKVEAGKTYYWCTCGLSKNQPFCDGSHAGTEFKPLAWTAAESKEVYFCACKKTANAPFCDGAHAKLPDESQFDLRTKSAVVAAKVPIGVKVEAGKTY